MNLRRDHSNILFGFFLEDKKPLLSERKQGEERGVEGDAGRRASFFLRRAFWNADPSTF